MAQVKLTEMHGTLMKFFVSDKLLAICKKLLFSPYKAYLRKTFNEFCIHINFQLHYRLKARK